MLNKLEIDQLFASIVFVAAIALTAFAYSPGVGGSYHFDDATNLEGLAAVEDADSAVSFIFEGIAGPLGRPLALASFVPQSYAWPDSPGSFLYVNICLHLLNGVLVVWLSYLLTSTLSGSGARIAGRTAALTGAIWMVFPILASSSLLIVQRMTTLSATFLLLGFIGYLVSRQKLEERPVLALSLMTASVVLGSTAAVLAKENGAILPLLILVAEATLLARPQGKLTVTWKAWKVAVLGLPSALLIGYLVLAAKYHDTTVLVRGFTVWDRLLTEAHILWEYLYNAFLPATAVLGPFHDDHVVHRDWLTLSSIAAVAGWLAVGVSAFLLRRRAPLFSFAVGWYLGAHLLESTTIALELYFEHRNYVPLIGPAFALAAGSVRTGKTIAPLLQGALCAYALLLAVVLFSTTSLWGQPALAAEMWAIRNPDSLRATQYLAQQLLVSGDSAAVRRTLSRYAEAHSESASVALQVLMLDCVAEPDKSHEAALEAARRRLQDARFEYAVFETLSDLYRTVKDGQCDSISTSDVYELALATAENPAFRAVPVAHHNLHVLMSEEAFASRDLNLTMHHVEQALSANYTMPTLRLAVSVLNSAGLYSEAAGFVQAGRERAPRHPIRSWLWHRRLDAMEDRIALAQGMSHRRTSKEPSVPALLLQSHQQDPQ